MSNGRIYMKDWFITQLCRTKVGFQVAYRLGLARPGIDFIDVGQDLIVSNHPVESGDI